MLNSGEFSDQCSQTLHQGCKVLSETYSAQMFFSWKLKSTQSMLRGFKTQHHVHLHNSAEEMSRDKLLTSCGDDLLAAACRAVEEWNGTE